MTLTHAQSSQSKADALLKKMTLEEKVGQMNQFIGLEYLKEKRAHLQEGDPHDANPNIYYPHVSIDTIASLNCEWSSGSSSFSIPYSPFY